MEGIQDLNSENIINALLNNGLVLLKKTDLEELLSSVALSNRVDNRKKYISHNEAIKMYGVTDYWLKKQRSDANTKLVCIAGNGRTGKWKYQIQSIENELDRLSF
ncbi:hypothetical protein [uncultured Tenacibaculum sp.]|uniref:hypothetical protein n=1 Tax=uncultured Tenacibaculum sp. TaxID=174713 RepID=UPI00261707FD|nr:hypothetical protein [uncultured Tenacibaculum sp.]